MVAIRQIQSVLDELRAERERLIHDLAKDALTVNAETIEMLSHLQGAITAVETHLASVSRTFTSAQPR